MVNDQEEDVLAGWLSHRQFEPCDPDAAERIILAASYRQQKIAFSLVGWLQKSFADCMFPQPAYMLASLLVLGFLIGFSTFFPNPVDEDDVLMPQLSFYDEGNVL